GRARRILLSRGGKPRASGPCRWRPAMLDPCLPCERPAQFVCTPGRQTAKTNRGVMRSLAKTLFTMLVTATLASGASALARANTEKGEPGGPSPPRRGADATLMAATPAAKASKAPTASKVAPAGRPNAPVVVAEPAAGASLPPVARPTPLPGESEHIARYDTAIAPLRNLTLAEEDAALLR